MRQSINRILGLTLCAICLLIIAQTTLAQTTQFTYQGKLSEGGVAPTGLYDFKIKLCVDIDCVTPIVEGTAEDVQVTAGIFTINPNFTASPFTTSPTANFLEISVRPGASAGAYTLLLPRQPLTSSPYAVQTLHAASAAVADNITGVVGIFNGGTGLGFNGAYPLPGLYLRSNGTGWTAASLQAADFPDLSTNYIQNIPGTGQQTGSFNVNGNGTVGGTFTGHVVNTATQFNIGGDRVLGVAGNDNTFAGVGAGRNNTGSTNAFFGRDSGLSNTIGTGNSFFGSNSGLSNNTGMANSFFGQASGSSNDTGNVNSFFGSAAGSSNTAGMGNSFFGRSTGEQNTLGQHNSFFGILAGDTNVSGSQNTVIGANADVASNNLSFATAIGADSVVSASNTVVLGRNLDTVRVPGNLNVAGTLTGTFTVPASNITGVLGAASGGTGLNSPGTQGNFLRSAGANWISSGLLPSDIPDLSNAYIQNQTTGGQSGSFNINGSGSVGGTLTGGVVNATIQYNIGGNRVVSVAGPNNFFAGLEAGQSNTGTDNSFVGRRAGWLSTTGSFNSFFGMEAGRSNMGFNNSFVGFQAGAFNSTGSNNSFVGASAGGLSTLTGSDNSFVGYQAGWMNNAGSANSFLGKAAGINNTTGSSNTFLGATSGLSNTSENNNTFIGNQTNGAANITNATAIGANAAVSQSNSLVLGSGVNVGIGTSAPQYALHVVGQNVRVEGDSFPRFSLSFTDGGPDQKRWQNYAAPNALLFSALNDVEMAETKWLQVNRGTGTAISSIVFPSAGNVGIGISPSYKLHVNGSVAGLGPYLDVSDLRYKRNIQSISDALDSVLRLRGVSYDWRQEEFPEMNFAKGRKVGFIAQEVERVFPEAVAKDDRGFYTVAYASVTPLLVEAIKQQQKTLEQLKQENIALHEESVALRERVAALEQLMKKLNEKP